MGWTMPLILLAIVSVLVLLAVVFVGLLTLIWYILLVEFIDNISFDNQTNLEIKNCTYTVNLDYDEKCCLPGAICSGCELQSYLELNHKQVREHSLQV